MLYTLTMRKLQKNVLDKNLCTEAADTKPDSMEKRCGSCFGGDREIFGDEKWRGNKSSGSRSQTSYLCALDDSVLTTGTIFNGNVVVQSKKAVPACLKNSIRYLIPGFSRHVEKCEPVLMFLRCERTTVGHLE